MGVLSPDAVHAVEALDLLERNVRSSQDLVMSQLLSHGWKHDHAAQVVRAWIRQGDYLLNHELLNHELLNHEPHPVDFVVGNLPYIRLEDVPDARMSAYRSACPTMGGRADTYVGFYEVGPDMKLTIHPVLDAGNLSAPQSVLCRV